METYDSRKYEIELREGQYLILTNRKEPVITPIGTVFKTPYLPIAQKVLEDLECFGPDSYTSAFSSLCYAYSYENLRHQNCDDEIKEDLSELRYEDDYWFQPACEGLPPARILWNHLFLDEDRGEEVRKWIKKLSSLQLTAVLVIFQSTENMNLAFLFAKIIENGNESVLLDIKNLYNNLLSSSFDEGHIDRLFELFKLFYTIESRFPNY